MWSTIKPSAPSPTTNVICHDGSFYQLVPEEVRKHGPWQGMHRGEAERLKPEYRLALARDGYALVRCELAVFKPEASKTLALSAGARVVPVPRNLAAGC